MQHRACRSSEVCYYAFLQHNRHHWCCILLLCMHVRSLPSPMQWLCVVQSLHVCRVNPLRRRTVLPPQWYITIRSQCGGTASCIHGSCIRSSYERFTYTTETHTCKSCMCACCRAVSVCFYKHAFFKMYFITICVFKSATYYSGICAVFIWNDCTRINKLYAVYACTSTTDMCSVTYLM